MSRNLGWEVIIKSHKTTKYKMEFEKIPQVELVLDYSRGDNSRYLIRLKTEQRVSYLKNRSPYLISIKPFPARYIVQDEITVSDDSSEIPEESSEELMTVDEIQRKYPSLLPTKKEMQRIIEYRYREEDARLRKELASIRSQMDIGFKCDISDEEEEYYKPESKYWGPYKDPFPKKPEEDEWSDYDWSEE